MNRPILSIVLAAALLPGLASADETTVYKSKDADGNTVYSQIETTGAQSQQVGGRDPAKPRRRTSSCSIPARSCSATRTRTARPTT
jgi:hypothetical protein